MKVDFNSLRRNAWQAYNELVNKLNGERNGNGLVKVLEEDIARPLNDLRDMLATLLCVYEPGDDDCRCIEMQLSVFAPEE